MAWTTTELDALKTQYALGVLSVTHNGRTTMFASGQDMFRRINQLESELASTTRMKPRYQQANFSE